MRRDDVPRTLKELHAQHRTRAKTQPVKAVQPGSAGGDNKALRGIPAIGRGVSGAIPGTSPHGSV